MTPAGAMAIPFLLAGLPAAAVPVQDETGTRVERRLDDGSTEVFHELAREGLVVRHGSYELRYPDGSRAATGEYEDGLRKGAWKTWFRSGVRESTGRYRRGRRQGDWTFWFDVELEAKEREGGYDEGRKDGWWNFWDEAGTHDAERSGYYRAERWTDAVGRTFEQELRRRDRGEVELREGEFNAWRADGSPWIEGVFHRGRRHGVWRFWHPGGFLDPEFVSGVYADGGKLSALAMLRSDDLPSVEDVLALTPFAPPDDPEEVLAREGTSEMLRRWMGEPDAQLARTLLSDARRLAPALLSALAGLDLEDENERALAARVHAELLVPVFGGNGLLWLPGGSSAEQARDRLTILRWHALWEVVATDDLFWELELPVAGAWEREVQGVSVVMNPPVPRAPRREVSGPAQRYARRFATNKRRYGESREVRAAIDLGLSWLADHMTDGAWDSAELEDRCIALDHEPCGGEGVAHVRVGLSALTLLAFLADGNLPDRGEHAQLVLAATRELVAGQDVASGRLVEPRVQEFLYQHALGTQALCELLPFADTPALRRAAQAAVDYLESARNPGGAWRYEVPPTGASDTSVTSWAVLALVAARDAGLEVDPAGFGGALAWLDLVTDPTTGRTGYAGRGSLSARTAGHNERFPREISEPLTAAALLCRVLLGQDPEEVPVMNVGIDLVARRPPSWTPDGVETDVYAWFFGTHALYQLEPRRRGPWRGWEPLLEETIAAAQRREGPRAGSWDPVGAWGYYGGRIYATALSTLTLSVHTSYARVLE